MRVRRTRFVFFYRDDQPFLDIDSMLRGSLRPAPLRHLYAISILSGRETEISDDDLPVAAMDWTVSEHYALGEEPFPLGDGRQFDGDLLRIFVRPADSPAGEPAARFLSQHEGELVTRVAYWTGEAAPLVRALVRVLRDRAATLALRVSGLEAATLIELTAFGTAVMMHWRYTRGVRAHGREATR